MTGLRKRMFLLSVVLAAIAACAIFYYASRVLKMAYADKSLIKMCLFVGLPVLFLMVQARFGLKAFIANLGGLFHVPKSGLGSMAGILGIGLLMVLAANLLVGPFSRIFGVEGILDEIRTRNQNRQPQFLMLILYIPLINALGEELFFRGLCSMTLQKNGFPRLADLFSAGLFAVYHLAIFQNWFQLPLLLLCLAGLFASALLLNRLVRRDGHLVGAWLVHGLFNVAMLSLLIRQST